ncbi:EFR1 family ferrodoxin [Elusimicrobiota bacterium]
MNVKIFYFSGTGNTLMTVRVLRDELLDNNVGAEIINIEDINTGSEQSAGPASDKFIMAFPVYYYGPPKIISRFLEQLPEGNGRDCCLVLNYGLLAVNTYVITAKLLKARGYNVSYCAGIRMPANYINVYNTHKPETNTEIINKSLLKIKEIAGDISAGRTNQIIKGNLLLKLPMRLLYFIYIKLADWMGSRYYADDKCTKCGLCVKLCPVYNVKMDKDEKPEWDHRCEQCVRCIHLCPEEAIQWFSLTKKRRRYKNPRIEVKDLTP